MKSQIEKYDQALLDWLQETFEDIVLDKELQLLFAPPDRPYAEVTSGRVVGGKTLRLPRIAVSRGDYTYDPSRRNQTKLRYCGPVSAAGLALNQANFPVPVNLPYQVSFWTEYETEMQAYFSHFMRQLYSGIVHITVYINSLWTNKITPYILQESITNNTEPAPGTDVREIRTTFSLECQAWIYDEVPTQVKTVREVIVNTYDFDTEVLWNKERVRTPFKIGEGDALEVTFAFALGHAVSPPSIVVYSTVGAAEVRGYDDGAAGVISGTGITGTINYATGAVSVTFTTAPDSGAGVYIEYEEA